MSKDPDSISKGGAQGYFSFLLYSIAGLARTYLHLLSVQDYLTIFFVISYPIHWLLVVCVCLGFGRCRH
jgi:hypothetical protein